MCQGWVGRGCARSDRRERARSGGWGGGAWVGPAHTKKRAYSPLLFPPAAVALWENDHTVVGHGE